MRRLLLFAIAGLMLLSVSSCSKTVVVTKKPAALPPGQMKKVTGSKSAAPYAPGQQKKITGSKSAASSAPGQQKKQIHQQNQRPDKRRNNEEGS